MAVTLREGPASGRLDRQSAGERLFCVAEFLPDTANQLMSFSCEKTEVWYYGMAIRTKQ